MEVAPRGGRFVGAVSASQDRAGKRTGISNNVTRGQAAKGETLHA
jgi:hypothetical protein